MTPLNIIIVLSALLLATVVVVIVLWVGRRQATRRMATLNQQMLEASKDGVSTERLRPSPGRVEVLAHARSGAELDSWLAALEDAPGIVAVEHLGETDPEGEQGLIFELGVEHPGTVLEEALLHEEAGP